MKDLSHYKKTDEFGKVTYQDEDGHDYESLEDFLHINILGFCGCGKPTAVLGLIYHLLYAKEQWSNNDDVDYQKYNEMRKVYLIENIDKVGWFFDYFLDKKELTTHGGNVSGSWVDDDNFYEALGIWYQEHLKENAE